MKVFVSGVAGFLGSHLADAFIHRGHEVVGCDNMIGGDLQNLPEGIQFEEADCGDVDRMKPLLTGVDLVYHCGAIATEGLSVFSPAIIAKHVYANTAGLLAAAASKRVGRFVYCSSMARYGHGKPPFREDQRAAPIDPYGIAKYAGELLVQNVCDTHGMEYVIAVPHNIIGPRQKYDDPYRNVASIMINRMLQGKQPIIYGDGEQNRSFSFVQDCVDPLLEMGTQKGLSREIINIGPDDEVTTINELARILAELLSFDLHPIYVAGPSAGSEKRDLLGRQGQETSRLRDQGDAERGPVSPWCSGSASTGPSHSSTTSPSRSTRRSFRKPGNRA